MPRRVWPGGCGVGYKGCYDDLPDFDTQEPDPRSDLFDEVCWIALECEVI